MKYQAKRTWWSSGGQIHKWVQIVFTAIAGILVCGVLQYLCALQFGRGGEIFWGVLRRVQYIAWLALMADGVLLLLHLLLECLKSQLLKEKTTYLRRYIILFLITLLFIGQGGWAVTHAGVFFLQGARRSATAIIDADAMRTWAQTRTEQEGRISIAKEEWPTEIKRLKPFRVIVARDAEEKTPLLQIIGDMKAAYWQLDIWPQEPQGAIGADENCVKIAEGIVLSYSER